MAKEFGTEEELMKKFRLAPTTDIQAQVLELIDRVDKGAVCSNNIQGPLVRDMRLAATVTRAAMSALSLRMTAGSDATLTAQLEEMRLEMASMRRENERLRLQVDSLRRRLKSWETTGTSQDEVDDMPALREPVGRTSSPMESQPQLPVRQLQPSQPEGGQRQPLQRRQQMLQQQQQQLQHQLQKQQQRGQRLLQQQAQQQPLQQNKGADDHRRQQRGRRRRHPSLLPSELSTLYKGVVAGREVCCFSRLVRVPPVKPGQPAREDGRGRETASASTTPSQSRLGEGDQEAGPGALRAN